MAPISEYYKGSGSKVMKSMAKRYGSKHGKEVFYAVANSRKGMSPKGKRKRSSKR